MIGAPTVLAQETARDLADALLDLAYRMKHPATGKAYRVVAEWDDGRTWTRRFFTKASALKTRESLLRPDPRDEWGRELAYPVPAIRVEIQVAEIGPWAPLEEEGR